MNEQELSENLLANVKNIQRELSGLKESVDEIKDDMENVRYTLHGNGDPGLKQVCAVLDTKMNAVESMISGKHQNVGLWVSVIAVITTALIAILK